MSTTSDAKLTITRDTLNLGEIPFLVAKWTDRSSSEPALDTV